MKFNPNFIMISNINLFCTLYQMVLHLLFLYYGNKSHGMPVNRTSTSKFLGIYGDFFHGDIALSPSARAAINSTINGELQKWPEGKFYYQFAKNYTRYDRNMVTRACMKMISDFTCIQFIEGKAADGSYVEFVKINPYSCYSDSIGKAGGRQEINLHDECITEPGVCAHEVLHALGFFHEQSRPDRDKYITITRKNIDPFKRGNYEIISQEAIDSFGSYYDYGSIMHYRTKAFALSGRNGELLTVFVPTKLFMIPWAKLENIGQKHDLSYEDVYQVQRLYNCCGIAWNYNSTAKSSSRSSHMSRTVTGLEKNAKSKKVKNHAKFPFVFAQALCKHYLKFIQTKDVQGLMKKDLTKDTPMGDDLHKKNVMWNKCSSRDSNCQPFLFEDQDEQHDVNNEIRQTSDSGEYGELFQGDLLNNPGGFTGGKWTWSSGFIPYVFRDQVAPRDQVKILLAMKEIEKRTCIKFVDAVKTVITPHLVISTSRRGCFATFGFNRSLQEHVLNLNSAGCLSQGLGVAVHELLHVLGMQHEHTKVTRDHWLTIKSNNVRQDKLGDFVPLDLKDFWGRVGPVDYASIMMVANNFRAKRPNLVTIEPKEDIGNIVMGQREQMTAEDIAKVLHLYECCSKNRRTHHVLLEAQT